MTASSFKDASGSSAGSRIGLNAANFFLAEMAGVILPFLSAFLKQKNWEYTQIGITVAASGLGMLLFQIPAGILSDKIQSRRFLLALSSIILGLCYGFLPAMVEHPLIVDGLLFVSGMACAFFVPLLAALALSLTGHKGFDKIMGTNQGWNHAGNIAAGLSSLIFVKLFGITAIFYVLLTLSFLAAASLLLIKRKELNLDLSKDKEGSSRQESEHEKKSAPATYAEIFASIFKQFHDSRVVILIISVVLFHIANAPTMAVVALYLKKLDSADDMVAWAVIIGQTAMVPVALLTGRFCGSMGRKPVMIVAFAALTLRIFLYSVTDNPNILLAIQLINGIDAGIYGVVICLICGDLTRGKEGFNSLLGITQTAIAFGGVLGPVAQGFLTQNLGFPATFIAFSVTAAIGGLFFTFKMPETKKDARSTELTMDFPIMDFPVDVIKSS